LILCAGATKDCAEFLGQWTNKDGFVGDQFFPFFAIEAVSVRSAQRIQLAAL